MQKIYVYDSETYPNFFLFTFLNIETKRIYRFEISDRIDEFEALKAFLDVKTIKYLIGFNNLSFDYPVLHKCILTRRRVMRLDKMFDIVESVISSKYSAIRPKEVIIPQVDLYKIWHYDNVNKATSLKWLEFAMRMENIEDLPYEPGSILDDKQKNHVLEYCDNDVIATDKFLSKSIKHIKLRKTMSEIEHLDLLNSSEIDMSKQILLKKLSKAALIDPWILRKQQTPRDEVFIKDVIFDYIEFEDPTNQEVLNTFKTKHWAFDRVTNKATSNIKFTRSYANVTREFAEGGLHSFGKPGIYKTEGDYLLVDVDFASYYPHLTFRNALHPEHIDEVTFNQVYEGFYHERKKYPKSDPRNYVLKIVLNGTYGLSKDAYSFLYDPKWQLAICINGQLLLTMLTERVFKHCDTVKPQVIFENTDGAMYRIHKNDYTALERACTEIEDICNIPLEIQVCKEIIARDVNNYINIITDENIKFKGAFEIDRDFHKNHSKRIVPLAVANYYIHGVDPDETIKNHLHSGSYSFADNHGIFDFCLGAKMKGQNKLYAREYDVTGVKENKLSKITRYFVANQGVELIKKLPPLKKNMMTATDKHKEKVDAAQMNLFDLVDDVKIEASDRETNLESGFKCSVLNSYDPATPLDSYDINYNYYLRECQKIIDKCGKKYSEAVS